MDFRLTQKWISEGKLRNLEKIINKGEFLPLISSNPSQSPVAWASLATGADPGKHGIFDFIKIERKNYVPFLSIHNLKKSFFSLNPRYERIIEEKTFWEKLSERNKRVRILKWPCTFPPFKVNGEFLSGFGVPDIKGGLGRYTLYASFDFNPENKRGDFIKIEFKNKKTKTHIKGPFKQTLQGRKEISIEFELILNEDEIIILINNKKIILRKKNWSEWVEFEFKIGGIKYKGIGKFYLISIKPEFKLYLSPINLSPLNEVLNLTFPKDYSKRLFNKYGDFSTLGMSEDVNALNDGIFEDEDFLSMVDFLFEEKRKMFLGETPANDYSVYAFVFETLDRVQHMFWNRNENIIESYYMKFDELVGELLNVIEDYELIIISDHGFGSLDKYVDLNAFLRDKGYLVLKGKEKSPPLFKNVDFKKTKAFACGFTSIYLNKKGREGKGILNEEEYLKEKENLKNILKNLDDNGRKVIKEVYDTSNIYTQKNSKNMPDLIIGFEEGYRTEWESVIGGVGKDVIKENKNKWKGDHIFDPSFVPGVFISSFKTGEKEIKAENFSEIILDYLK